MGVKLGRCLRIGVVYLIVAGALARIAGGAEPEELTLSQSIRIALQKQPAVAGAKADVESARARLSASRTAFLPSARFTGNYTRLDQDRVQPMKFDLGMGQEQMSIPILQKYQYSLSGQVTQPLFMGGSIYYAHKQAKAGLALAEDQFQSVQQDVALRVVAAYYSVLRAEKLLDVARKAEKAMQAHQETARNFYETGLVAKVDLLQAEVRLAESTQEVIRAQNAVEAAKSAFNSVLGRDISEDVALVEEHFPTSFAPSLAECLEEAEANRPELVAMRESVRLSKLSERQALASFFPQIMAVYEHDFNKQPLDWKTDEMWSVSVVASWDVWQWGKRKYDLDYARAKTRQAEAQLQGLRDAVRLEVKQAYLAVQEARKRIAVAQSAIRQAEENERMSKERYAQSICTMTEVLDAEALLARARTNYYVALYDFDVAVARLLRSMGRPIGEQWAALTGRSVGK